MVFKNRTTKKIGAKGLAKVIPFWWGGRLPSLLLLMMAVGLFTWSSTSKDNLSDGLRADLRAQTMDIFTPLLGAVSAPVETAANYVRDITGLAALQAENARLREENIRLREWYRTALVLKQENTHLQSLLNVKQGVPYRYVTARVVADGGNAYAKTLLVSSGYGDGVNKNQPAMSPDGVIGRVIEVGERAARVLLLTDMNSRVPVYIQGMDIKAVMAGQNNDFPLLKHLPPEHNLQEGAAVVTSGHGGVFPYGLPVGDLVKNKDGEWGVKLYAPLDHMSFIRIVDAGIDPNLRQGKLD